MTNLHPMQLLQRVQTLLLFLMPGTSWAVSVKVDRRSPPQYTVTSRTPSAQPVCGMGTGGRHLGGCQAQQHLPRTTARRGSGEDSSLKKLLIVHKIALDVHCRIVKARVGNNLDVINRGDRLECPKQLLHDFGFLTARQTQGVPLHLLGSFCLPPEERCLLMPEISEKEREVRPCCDTGYPGHKKDWKHDTWVTTGFS
ncbi:hypothetical protein HJG60_009840 [Phyllostomus discolor]|uniref:Uncharacterized protein n=1 Tax=Phyllostomus discolor TaxID=89673 RepID=A0A834BCD3_9CHIR|nr:hypothetical protein HJG60_009840 [Phyllostomus discolor]